MRDVYACRLPLAEAGTSAFEQALRLVAGEVAAELHLSPTVFHDNEGSTSLEGGVALRWRLLTVPGVEDRLWTLRWQRPHEDDHELMAHLNVDVALESGCAWVGVRLALRPTGHRVLPVRFDVRTRRLVAAVVNGLEVIEDGWTLTPEPDYAVDDEGVHALAELMLHPDRVLPVVARGDRRRSPGLSSPVAARAPGRAPQPTLRVGAVAEGGLHGDVPGQRRFPRRPPSGRGRGHGRGEIAKLFARAKDASLGPEWQGELERAWSEIERLREENAELALQLAFAHENLLAISRHSPGAVVDGAPRLRGRSRRQPPERQHQRVRGAARCYPRAYREAGPVRPARGGEHGRT